jgi:glycosyltransferase involved in cell wall biosynthesis
MMRITIVQGAFLPVPPIMGGAVEKIWFALGKEFARRGHSVTHISRRHAKLKCEEYIEGVHHVRVHGFDTTDSLLKLKWLDLIYSRRVLEVLPEADILLTNTFWLPLLAPKPKHGKIYVHVARYPKGQIRFYFNAARLQTVSRPIKEAICEEAPRMASRVNVIPNFVPSVDERLCDGVRDKTILFVGRVHPEKGVHLLLDAFGLLLSEGNWDWRLRVVGPWEANLGGGGTLYMQDLRDRSRRFANNVDWLGPVFDADALNEHYSKCPLFVYPSLAEHGETFGLAPLEAMAAGCAPVVSSLLCFQDFVVADVNGWIFDHRSENRTLILANLLKHLIGDSDILRKAGECACRTARKYTLPKIASQFLSDFEGLCQ